VDVCCDAHNFLILLLDNVAGILSLDFAAGQIQRDVHVVPNCILVLRTLVELLEVGLVVEVDVFDVGIASAIEVHQVAALVVGLTDCGEVLVTFVEGMAGEDKVGQQPLVDHLHLRSVRCEALLQAVAAVQADLVDALVPDLEDSVPQRLDLKEALRLLRVPQKVVKHLVTVVEGGYYLDLPDVEAHVQSVQ
jgi:hypothetical protein